MSDVDVTNYPALAEWLEKPGRTIVEKPGDLAPISIVLFDGDTPKYGLQDDCRERLLETLNYHMHKRLMGEVPTNAPGSGRDTN